MRILIILIFIVSLLLSGCIDKTDDEKPSQEPISAEYPLLFVKTTHHVGTLGSSCDYTEAYYHDNSNELKSVFVKPCSIPIGTPPKIHLLKNSTKEKIIIVTGEKIHDYASDIYITEKTFVENSWAVSINKNK